MYFVFEVSLLIMLLLGHVETSSISESQSSSFYAGLYMISHHFVILACIFPLAYFISHLKRNVFAGLSFIILFLLNSAF